MGRPFNEKYADVKWEVDEDEENLRKWKEGKTGVPIVDAAMRQMNTIGEFLRRCCLMSPFGDRYADSF